MDDFTIFYICDRKACKNCYEYCKHTSDIEHAEHRHDLNGRMFQFLDNGDASGFFEEE